MPVVATIHEDSGWLQEEIEMNNAHIQFAWKNADALIRVNKKEVPLLKKLNPRVFFVPNGFPLQYKPLNRQESRSHLGVPAEKKVIFGLGDLIGRKGFSYLIDSINLVHGKYPDVMCYIGGSGPEKAALELQIHNLGFEDRISLLGFLPEDKVPLWINSADLFVLPSLNEGNPTVMFECLGCGIPFIGTDVGGIPEIIVSDKYGYVCKPADPVGLADVLVRALARSWNRECICQYAQQFSWDSIGHELLAIYQQVVETPSESTEIA